MANPFLSPEQQARARALNEGRVASAKQRGEAGLTRFLSAAKAAGPALAEGALSLLPGSGDVMSGMESVRAGSRMSEALRAGRFGEAAGAALESLGHGVGVLPLIPSIIIGQRVGKAMGKDGWLKTAKIMDAAGVDQKRIHRSTGWFKHNGTWKSEVPDQGARFKRGQDWRDTTAPDWLHNLLEHPDDKLLRGVGKAQGAPGVGIAAKPMEPHQHGAYYSPEHFELPAPLLEVNRTLNDDEALSTILHELQHAVQDAEGWPAGSSMQNILNGVEGRERTLEFFRNIVAGAEELQKEFGAETWKRIFNDRSNGVAKSLFQEALFKTYRDHPGEVEARLVQQRFAKGK